MELKVKRLDTSLPQLRYEYDSDSGFDLYVRDDITILPWGTAKIPTGICFEIPPKHEIQIRPRSGISLNTKIRVIFGTVDQSYTGEVSIITDNNSFNPITIKRGERIAQAVLVPTAKADILHENEETVNLPQGHRGSHGFGSSGVS